jgi:hypothetical protein
MPSLIPSRLKTLRPGALMRNAAEVALLAAALLPARALTAQAPAPAIKSTNQQPGSAAKSSAAKAPGRNAVAAPAQPPAPAVTDAAAKLPPAPAWPANEHPQQAHVTWDSHGLRIAASNSSLNQILHEVSTDTGVKVEGFGKDQRIFGTYGPGPAREVLSRLLDGSGYNVLMVGGTGDAPPSRIVLSTASPSGPAPPPGMQNRQNDEDVEAEEPQPEEQPQPPPPMPQETPQPTPIRNPFGDMQHMPGPPMTQPVAPDQQQTNPQQ